MESELLCRSLLALRAGARLSQDQVGRESEVGRMLVARVEAGAAVPDRHTLHLLLRTLGVTPSELVAVSEILERAERRRQGELPFEPPPPVAEPVTTPAPTEGMQEAGRWIAQGLLRVLRDPSPG